jgi:hypothetical protein
MDAGAEMPEITEACWGILGRSLESVMCATVRMVVKGKGAAHPVALAAHSSPMTSASNLARVWRRRAGAVPLNYPHCAMFCVLGGGACGRG